MIVVLDASVLVSAILKRDSIPERVLLAVIGDRHRLIVSAEVEAEYRHVLGRPKFDRFVSIERRLQVLEMIALAATRVDPVDPVRECADANDDKYLALAAAGRAQSIVTGDERHLLPMTPWRGIEILRPAEFLALSEAASAT